MIKENPKEERGEVRRYLLCYSTSPFAIQELTKQGLM